MRKQIIQLVMACLIAIAYSCGSNYSDIGVKPSIIGFWEASVRVGEEEKELPFKFEVVAEGDKEVMYLINASERIKIEDLKYEEDSVTMGMHIFNTAIRAKISEGKLEGTWVKKDYEDYVLPFKATRRDSIVLPSVVQPEVNMSGKWAVAFEGENGEEEPAIGVFKQKGQFVAGTFLTPTGDYRYLSGTIAGNQFQLSCFDGEHAFLFKGTCEGNTISDAHFWSGKNWHQTWRAEKNDQASLPDANTLTYLKEGYEKVSFRFSNLEGKEVSLEDERFEGKVVLIQLMGSWCPNCMDETAFLAPYYEEHKSEGLEIIALAFERNPAFEVAKGRLEKLKKRFGISYEILIAGSNSKQEAAEKLPMLNHVMSFPTTIFIDRQGVVRKIHTGFAGPGTGEYYTNFVEEFKLFMDKLLAEKAL